MFKIIVGEKQVLLSDNFSKYSDYKQLRETIISNSQAPAFKKNKTSLKESNRFILKFNDDSAIIGLESGIWDNPTYQYFLEKIATKKDQKFRFTLEKVGKYPIWKKKELIEVFENSLTKVWEPLEKEIKKALPLNILEKSKVEYDKIKNSLNSKENINNEEHINILCNNCFKKNFKGNRFICAECNNYNLCEECEKINIINQIHPREHVLIKIKKPLNDEIKDNLFKYNAIFGNNNKTIQIDSSSFKYNFSIANNGENDLMGCYISAIRFGDGYMSCVPKVIESNLKRNNKIELPSIINAPSKKGGIYEGYFRMFTPNGLPFGDVLKIVGILNE